MVLCANGSGRLLLHPWGRDLPPAAPKMSRPQWSYQLQAAGALALRRSIPRGTYLGGPQARLSSQAGLFVKRVGFVPSAFIT